MRVEWSAIISPYTEKAVEDFVAPALPGLALLAVRHPNGEWQPVEAISADDIREKLIMRLQRRQGWLMWRQCLHLEAPGGGFLPAGFMYAEISDPEWRRGFETYLHDLWGTSGRRKGGAAISIPGTLP